LDMGLFGKSQEKNPKEMVSRFKIFFSLIDINYITGSRMDSQIEEGRLST